MKEKALLLLIFGLFLSTIILSAMYVSESESHPYVKLTPEMANNMTKTEIISFYQEQEELQKSNTAEEILVILIGVIGFILGAATTYLLKPTNKSNVKVNEIIKLLPKKEGEVIKILIEKGGEAQQSYIRNRLGINKVAMTRLVEKMELEGKINVVRGRTNYIRLNSDIMKVLK